VTRPFRFGVVAPIQTELPTWRDRVRRIADSGYSTLLMPDAPAMAAGAWTHAGLRGSSRKSSQSLHVLLMPSWPACRGHCFGVSSLTSQPCELGIARRDALWFAP
jgi:hypothetical protein